MVAYKLFSLRKDGTLGSLFINKKRKLPTNEWLQAEKCPTKGYKYRPYWHCVSKPFAPHLSLRGRVWAKILIKDYTHMSRPANQGSKWYLANQIKIVEVYNV